MKKKFRRQDQSKHTEQFSYTKDITDTLARNMGSEFLKYRERLENAVKFKEEPEFPIHIDFETIFGCNIRCVMCTHADKKSASLRQRFMKFDLFKQVIDEGAGRGLASIGLDQEGEPLLVKNLTDYIAYARKKGISDVMINTNALLLDKEKTDELLHSGLTRIQFSLDAVTEKTYEKIRKGSNFKKVTDNILYFCRRKKELKKDLPVTRASFVKMKYNEHELDSFIKFWTSHIDFIAVQEYNNAFPENMELNAVQAKSRIVNTDFRCTQPWFRLVVLTDSTVLPCCLLGISLKMSIGNAYESTISELWNSNKMKDLRRLHSEKRYNEHEVCRVCAQNFL